MVHKQRRATLAGAYHVCTSGSFFCLSKAKYSCVVLAMSTATMLTACSNKTADAYPVVTTNTQQASKAFTALAIEHLQQNKLDIAMNYAQKALAIDPLDAQAVNVTALILQSQGSTSNIQKAQQLYADLLQHLEKTQQSSHVKSFHNDILLAQISNNYAVLLANTNNDTKALPLFVRASETLGYTGRKKALENVISTANSLQKYTVMQKASNSLLQAEPYNHFAHTMLIEAYIKQKQFANAMQAFNALKKALPTKRNPTNQKQLQIILLYTQ